MKIAPVIGLLALGVAAGFVYVANKAATLINNFEYKITGIGRIHLDQDVLVIPVKLALINNSIIPVKIDRLIISLFKITSSGSDQLISQSDPGQYFIIEPQRTNSLEIDMRIPIEQSPELLFLIGSAIRKQKDFRLEISAVVAGRTISTDPVFI